MLLSPAPLAAVTGTVALDHDLPATMDDD
jgi:hypothetical protein